MKTEEFRVSKPVHDQSANQFQNEKRQTLAKVDKSIAASIDAPIREIVDLINHSEHYFTTSSCSGRVIVTGNRKQLLTNNGDDSLADNIRYNHKKDLKWLFNSHEIIEEPCDDLIRSVLELGANYETLTFKFEPAILHIRACHSSDSTYARKLLNTAIASGFRNSGMVLSQSKHCTVAIRSTASLEVPLVDDGQLLITTEYLHNLVKIANRKMRFNFELIERFQNNLCELFESLQL